jgi:tetratricopeptide (TPR) repeat protein
LTGDISVSIYFLFIFERKALGDTYFAMNEFGQAIDAWQEALFRKDAFLRKSTFLSKLPELLRRSKLSDVNFKIGLSYFELARQYVEPSQRKATFQQATVYLKQFLDQNDEPTLQRKSFYLLGILHLELGEYEEAISDF